MSPHMLEDGSQVSATNVVIQVVEVTNGRIVDAAGNPSPNVELIGSGRAYVLRDGRVIKGRWERDGLDELTRFMTKEGPRSPSHPAEPGSSSSRARSRSRRSAKTASRTAPHPGPTGP